MRLAKVYCLFLFIVFLCTSNLMAENVYVSAIGGDSNDFNTWVKSDGTALGRTPIINDDIFLTASSGNLNINANLFCRSFNATSFTGRITHKSGNTVTIGDGNSGPNNIALKFDPLTIYEVEAASSAFSFTGSASSVIQEIDFANKVTGNISFSHLSGKWKFIGPHKTLNDATVTLYNGELDLNGQTFHWGKFDSNFGTGARALKLGASQITLHSGAGTIWNVLATSLTVDPNTATLIILAKENFGTTTTFSSDVSDWKGLSLVFKIEENGGPIYNLATADSNHPVLDSINTATTIKNLTVLGDNIEGQENVFEIKQDLNITDILALEGYSGGERLRINGNGKTITIPNDPSALELENVDFQDITIADGSGNPINLSAITGGAGDLGACHNITFTTGTTLYFYAGTDPLATTKRWGDANNWFFDTAHTQPANRIPLRQDHVRFDANSFSYPGVTVRTDRCILGTNIDWTGVTNNPTWDFITHTASFGDLILDTNISAITASYAIGDEGETTHKIGRLTASGGSITIDTKGVPLPFTEFRLGEVAFSGSNSLTGFSSTTNTIYIASDLKGPKMALVIKGTVEVNVGVTVTTEALHVHDTLVLNSSIMEITGHNYVIHPYNGDLRFPLVVEAGATINPGASTIKFTNTTPLPKTIQLSNKNFYDIEILGTQRATFNFLGGANSIHDFTATQAGNTLLFEKGKTFKFTGDITLEGTDAKPVSLASTEARTQFTWDMQGSHNILNCDYVWVSDSKVIDGGNTTFFISNTYDINNNSNWQGLNSIASITNAKIWTNGDSDNNWGNAYNWSPVACHTFYLTAT